VENIIDGSRSHDLFRAPQIVCTAGYLHPIERSSDRPDWQFDERDREHAIDRWTQGREAKFGPKRL
jgi:hypothetical protein